MVNYKFSLVSSKTLLGRGWLIRNNKKTLTFAEW